MYRDSILYCEKLAQFLVDLVLQSGSSLKLIPVINVSIVLLLGVPISLTYSKIATIHLVVMATLASGLLVSLIHSLRLASITSTTSFKK